MSARHLLSCPCGKPIPVATSQAGGSVACPECGASQTVPRLRDLRELPLEPTSGRARGGWGFRQGVLTTGLLVSAALAAGGAWFAANEPAPPAEFNAANRNELITADLDRMSALDLWALYEFRYAPMRTNGMQVAENPQDAVIERAIERSRFGRKVCLYAAGGVLALAVGVFALVRP